LIYYKYKSGNKINETIQKGGKKMKLTEKEKQVILNIAENLYSAVNGDIPESLVECGSIWANCINEVTTQPKVPEKSLPGICGSLVKKDLIFCDKVNILGTDACIQLTEKGFEIYQNLKNGTQ
jgi:hypothetical protein